MEQKVQNWIAQNQLFSVGDTVIVAFSGGADSMALLHYLHSHRVEWSLTLSAAHFEHGLRGEESLRDAAFVRQVCGQYGLPLYYGEGHMAWRPSPKGLGTEEWARRLRYDFFDSLARENNAKIALAHTLSDNAETVLFRAVRGTGPKGLGGIPPVRGFYVRPLLSIDRQEIEAYCVAHRLAFVQDTTNKDNQYSRNRLRNEVFPLLEQVHPGAAKSLARMAADMRALDEWLLAQATVLLADAKVAGQGANLDKEMGHSSQKLLAAPGPVRLKALAILAGDAADRAALERMEQVLGGKAKAAQLPGGKTASLQNKTLFVGQKQTKQALLPYEIPLAPGTIILPGGYKIFVEWCENGANRTNCEKKDQKGLLFVADCDKIINCGVLRTRRAKDMFAPKGRGVTKTIKKWMNEESIPALQRDAIPLLADGSTVLWVWGAGFCQDVQPDANTKNWLLIHCLEN